MWLVLAGAQVEGTAIPEAVPEAEVIVGSATEPAVTAAPEVIEEMHDDALPKTNMDIVIWSPEIQEAEPIRLALMSEARQIVVMGSNFWQMTLSTRRW
jgi:hypothetical protein